MQEMSQIVTLWVAWYRGSEDAQISSARPRRLLQLRMLHASSREEARGAMYQWLERQGLHAQDLMRLEPSPYGLQFQTEEVH